TGLPVGLDPNVPLDLFKDAYSIDLTGEHALPVRAAPKAHVSLAMDGLGEELAVQGTVNLAIADVISVSGSVRVKQTRANVILAGSPTTPVAADLLEIGGANLSARLSTGTGSNALGFGLTGLDMALVFTSTTSTTDNRRWLSLSGTADKIGLLGTSAYGLTAEGTNLALDINMGLG
ncbi:MAG: hypothetical protein HQL87_17370, partial [Magnetococcales bacterium]|nr:hypothetical protein [Magnetococcales bacterium]